MNKSGFLKDIKTLYQLTLASKQGETHQDRLEAFYKTQASHYDDFRKRLLHGREELFANMPSPEQGSRWIDLGGGTASNLELISEAALDEFEEVTIVDLSASLLEQAKKRVESRGWENIRCKEADVCQFKSEEPVDWVTLSYSLTMIPDWYKALEQAWKSLKPGGHIGVVDFYVQRKWAESHLKHNWFQRTFWPTWFGFDNVFLNPDHLPYLRDNFATVYEREALGSVPYLGLKAPYYIFIGQKPG